MTTTSTFSALLKKYLGGSRRLRNGYWQEYKRKAWRLFGVRIRNNPALRAAVLERAEKRRYNHKIRRSLLVEEFLKRDFILSTLAKDESWNCGTLIVPFKPRTELTVNHIGNLANRIAKSIEPEKTKLTYTQRFRHRIFGILK